MEPDDAQAISERDQLWASLRALRPEIERIAAGAQDDSERGRTITVLLARIVIAELNYRQREAGE
jgi:hypothetical protein